MEVRNRKSKVKETKKKTEVILHNEDDWDYAAIAKKKMDFVRLNDPDGTSEPQLSEAEQKRVKRFQAHVAELEYKRMSSKYGAKPIRTQVQSVKTPIRQALDTLGPLLTVLVTLVCCLFSANYFLYNVVHEMAGRIAIGLVAGSILGKPVFILNSL